MGDVLKAVGIGMFVMLAGTIPRIDAAFVRVGVALLFVAAAMVWAYVKLAGVAREAPGPMVVSSAV